MQLLQDVFIIENLQILSEGAGSDKFKLRGVFGRCNEKNNNGRIYPTAVFESQLQKIQPLINERRLCGELDHPQNDTVKLSNASHLITKLELKGDELIGEAELLKTPAGLTAKALVEGGVKIGISSRGMGTLSEDSQGNKIVNEDFRLVTFDLVADPSTRGAYPTLSESVESKFVRESSKKLQKEYNFVTMLENKLKDAYQPWLEEAKKNKKLTKNQEVLDVDCDGEIESEDLSKLRARKIVKEALASFTKETLEEDFATELEKSREDSRRRQKQVGADNPDTGSVWRNIRAQQQAKNLEIARAKGVAKGSKIIAKGDVKSARIRQRAAERAAAGKPVTGGEMAADLAGKAAGAVAAAPGKIISGAERLSKAVKDAGTGAARRAYSRKQSEKNIADRKKADRDARLAAASGQKPKPQAKKPGISDEEKYQRKALGQAELKKATADVSARAKKGAEGQFGAGLGRSDKEDMQKAIARRERKTGKKVNLTPKQALELSHRVYRQLGLHLAEAFGLIEGADAPMKGSPRGVNLGEPGNSGESRKAGYNDQYTRNQNKAAKERERAKRRHPSQRL